MDNANSVRIAKFVDEEGLSDVDFPSDKWSGIAFNSRLGMEAIGKKVCQVNQLILLMIFNSWRETFKWLK